MPNGSGGARRASCWAAKGGGEKRKEKEIEAAEPEAKKQKSDAEESKIKLADFGFASVPSTSTEKKADPPAVSLLSTMSARSIP